MKFRKFRLMDNADASGGGGVSDADQAKLRGDFMPQDLDPVADEKAVAATAAADAAAAALEAELAAKGEAKGEKTDADPDPEAKGDDADPDKNKRIPLSRHKAILEREREQRTALETQLAQYQKGTEVAKTNESITEAEDEVLAKETKYTELLAEGKLADAAKVMAEIRAIERQIGDAKNDMRIQASEARAAERVRYSTALARIEGQYDVLNEDHDDFDPDQAKEVLDLKAAYQSRGMTPTDALQKAVKILLGAQTAAQKSAVDVTPRVTEKDVAAERKKDAVDKTVKAVGKTPPSTTKIGLDSDKAGGGAMQAEQVIKMPYKDFATLNEETLSQLRGDTI